jgi:integrase
VPLTEHAKTQHQIALACSNSKSEYLFPNVYDIRKPIDLTSLGKVARRLMSDFDLPPFQLKDLRRTFKTHLLDGEYVEEREIDIWHNHGQHSDVARKHYTWAEYRKLKQRVAGEIDKFLDEVGV